MTEQEAVEYREEIAALLRTHGASWIVDQANEQMASGKLQTKRVDASETVVHPVTQAPRRSSRKSMAEFLFTVPYSETEKLSILLEAIDLALISPVSITSFNIKDVMCSTTLYDNVLYRHRSEADEQDVEGACDSIAMSGKRHDRPPELPDRNRGNGLGNEHVTLALDLEGRVQFADRRRRRVLGQEWHDGPGRQAGQQLGLDIDDVTGRLAGHGVDVKAAHQNCR